MSHLATATTGMTEARHRKWLAVLSPTIRIATRLLLNALSRLPQFDSSAAVSNSDANPLLRWDAFHFVHIAQYGYVHEYEWAFFPGISLAMRLGGKCLSFVHVALGGKDDIVSVGDLLNGGALAALICDPTITLYRLTLRHFHSPHLALMVSLLSLMPSSPATLHAAAYSEPFYTYMSYKGMLCCTDSQWLLASIWFALAACFRSNGILLSGFVIWGLIIQPFIQNKRVPFLTVPYSLLLTSITFVPFAYQHYAGYMAYCTSSNLNAESEAPSWCNNMVPSIYTHVQAKYWNSGFLQYWTLAQIPNFLIAAPVYALLLSFCLWHVAGALHPQLNSCYSRLTSAKRGLISSASTDKPSHSDPFLSSSITPHALHSLFLTFTLLFNSHVQIMLRQAASMPVVYWAAAWLFLRDGGDRKVAGRWGWGRLWVGWSVIWGAISLILWVTFLPPA